MSGLEVADIFRRHGEAWRQARHGHLGRVERRVMSAIELCRTVALGGHVEGCLRISEIRDRDFTKSRTAVSEIPGQCGVG